MLDNIGKTPTYVLRGFNPESRARVVIKLELSNPTGSMKDRMALAMVDAVEKEGKLQPGDEIVEYTGGSTGSSLAFIAAARGYKITIVTSDAFSLEKRRHMAAFGANVILVPSTDGQITANLFARMREEVDHIVAERGAFWTDQFSNVNQASGYEALAEEAWKQTSGEIDAFVHSVGTGGSFRGISKILRQHRDSIETYAVEPTTSAVLSGGPAGSHGMEGMGTGRVVPMWDPSLATGIETVSTEEAEDMARSLARQEALFAGTSTGANLVAALRVAQRLGPGKTVLTIAVDNGLKYVTTPLYASS